MTQAKVLVCSSEESDQLIQDLFSHDTPAYRFVQMHSIAEAVRHAQISQIEAVILSSSFPVQDLKRSFQLFSQISPRTKRVLFTRTSSVPSAELIHSLPIDDLLTGTISLAQAAQRIIALRNFPYYKHSPPKLPHELRGTSTQLNDIRDQISLIREKSFPVLIHGETGTGKDLVAQMLNHRPSSIRPFVAVNCSSLPDQLAESELFGHSKGAFTSAVTARSGAFESAIGGDLFLDEIGELSPVVQAKLLRVLNDGTYTRLGENVMRHSNARIIAATHRNLAEMVSRGLFREDLFFRLNVFTINIPPLRERAEDVLELARYLQLLISGGARGLSRAAIDQLASLPLPGNARELRNILERANLSCEARGEHFITPVDFGAVSRSQHSTEYLTVSPVEFRNHMKKAERHFLTIASAQIPNRTELARALGISRSKLFALLGSHNLTRQKPEVARSRQ